MHALRITRHARQRLQQRGARQKDIEIVITYGDIEIPANAGCRFVRLSHRAAASLLEGHIVPTQQVDRAKRIMVLMDPSDRVVTLIKTDPVRRFPAARREGNRR